MSQVPLGRTQVNLRKPRIIRELMKTRQDVTSEELAANQDKFAKLMNLIATRTLPRHFTDEDELRNEVMDVLCEVESL